MVRSLQRPAYRIRTTTRVFMPPTFVFKDLYRLVKLALSLGPKERHANPELTDHILCAADNMILKLLNEPQTPAPAASPGRTFNDAKSNGCVILKLSGCTAGMEEMSETNGGNRCCA